MATCMKNSRIQIETPYALWEARSILFKRAASIIPAMTCSSSVIPSTLIHTQTLCCALLLTRKVLNPTGMREFLESIMPTFGLRIRRFLVPETSGAWIFFGSVGLARNQAIVQDFVERACPK